MGQLRYHFDAIARLDDNLNTFFGRQLEQIRPQLYQRKYPIFKGRKFLPVKNDINPGVQIYTYQTIDETGEALPITDRGDDAPTVELKGGSEDSHKMRGIQIAYEWTLDEARAAAYAGQDLDVRKANAAHKAIERFIDKNMLLGGTVNGAVHQGLFTFTGSFAPTTYTSSVTTWEDETPDDIAIALAGQVTQVITDTLETEIPNTALFPVTTMRLLRDRRMGDGSNVSILDFFMGSHKDTITSVDTSLYLEPSSKTGKHSGGNVKRVVMYTKDEEHLEALVNEMEQLPPEYREGRVRTLCRARVGGVANPFPKAVCYSDSV